MPIDRSDSDRLEALVANSLHAHWGLFLAEGIALLVLGVGAIAVPPLASFAVALFLGWLFLLGGLIGLATTAWMRAAPGFWWSLLSAVLGIVTGILLIGWPAGGVVSITLVFIAYFFVDGIASIMLAIEHRRALSGRWGWLLASGLADLVLGGLILAGLPATALWGLGLLVGLNMAFAGISLIAMALHARKAGPGR